MTLNPNLINIIVIPNNPTKQGLWCPQSYIFDKMERGLITEKDILLTNKSIDISKHEVQLCEPNWFDTTINVLIKLINVYIKV